MSTKVIYFLVDDRPEQAEFRSDFPADDIKGECWLWLFARPTPCVYGVLHRNEARYCVLHPVVLVICIVASVLVIKICKKTPEKTVIHSIFCV